MPAPIKRCAKCDKIKPIEAYRVDSMCKDGHRNVCLDCHHKQMREYNFMRSRGLREPKMKKSDVVSPGKRLWPRLLVGKCTIAKYLGTSYKWLNMHKAEWYEQGIAWRKNIMMYADRAALDAWMTEKALNKLGPRDRVFRGWIQRMKYYAKGVRAQEKRRRKHSVCASSEASGGEAIEKTLCESGLDGVRLSVRR